ncbi:unnamed protein product [Aureobasidium pullulans]|nr:unnamed protein product [Aureobasidium pullulans]
MLTNIDPSRVGLLTTNLAAVELPAEASTSATTD